MLDIDINVNVYGRLMTDTHTTSPRSSTASNAFPWLPILALSAATLWTVTAELLPAGLLLDIGSSLGVRPSTVGYLVTVWGLAIALLSLPLARATERMDRRTLLVASLAVTGVATMATALAPSYSLLVLARLVAAAAHGLFWSQVVVVGSALAGERHAARAVAVIVAGPTVAGVVSIPAATALGEAVGWRLAFELVGALTAATTLLVLATLPRLAPPAAQETGRRDETAARVVVTAVLGGALLVGHFLTFTYVAPLLVDVTGMPKAQVSLAMFVFGVAGLFGVLVAPRLNHRLPVAALPLTAGALAVALLVVGTARGEVGALAMMAAWGLVIGVLPVVFQTRLLVLASPAYRPTAGAVMVVALNLGVASGAAAGSPIDHRYGAAPLPLVAAALAALVTLLLAVSARKARAAGMETETDSVEPDTGREAAEACA